ncbi:hypothetical protein [Methyloceanibacter sp. wino2]|uniref:hypothetical protein n=1 Tax=Methyloceanibacter sp. wino2 TaxID=2170729 RepID=UPI000D3E31EA|nr:hypothetical protein [Methyloceanibacter sp. wino2]
MTITLGDIAKLRSGWCEIIEVGNLPFGVASEIGVFSTLVYLSRESLLHINEKHPDISDIDLLLSCLVIQNGMVVQEKAKPNAYVCSYIEPNSQLRYVAVLKVASPDREMLMTSFRRLRRRQTRSFLRRGRLIKKHP